jgi:hypothetical protein
MTNTFFNTNKITVAVVTGRHPHDVPNFHAVFRSIPDIDFYPQHMEDFVFNGMSPRGVKSWKGVVKLDHSMMYSSSITGIKACPMRKKKTKVVGKRH